jgi:hypothetical protein
MTLLAGDDFVSGDIFSFQQANRMKNHWAQAAAPASPQPGMLHHDTDDSILYHRATAGPAWEQIVQTYYRLGTR